MLAFSSCVYTLKEMPHTFTHTKHTQTHCPFLPSLPSSSQGSQSSNPQVSTQNGSSIPLLALALVLPRYQGVAKPIQCGCQKVKSRLSCVCMCVGS